MSGTVHAASALRTARRRPAERRRRRGLLKAALPVVAVGIGLADMGGVSRALGAVTFNFTYSDPAGVGFNDPALGTQRRAALEEVANNVIGPTLIHTATVDIQIAASQFDGTGFLASANSSLNLPNGSQGFFSRNVGHRILTGIDRNGATADGTVTWDFGYSYYLGTGSPGGALDFRTIALHELTHCIGFTARVDQNGNGFDPGGDGGGHAYNTFDQFLENASGTPLIDPATNRYNAAAALSDMTTGQVFFDGTNARLANGGSPIELFTPSTYQAGSSVSHFNNLGVPMDPSVSPGLVRRDWTRREVGVLRDLGFTVAILWVVDADGQWTTAGNWSSNPGLPAVTDNVRIDRAAGDFLVTLGSAVSVNSLVSNERLTISGGSLTLAAASQINNTLTLNSGTLSANGALTLAGATNSTSGVSSFSGSGNKDLTGAALNVAGTLTWTGTGDLRGFSSGPTASAINIAAGGLFDVQNNEPIANAGHTINNAGTLRKSVGVGTTAVDWTLNNQSGGQVQVQTGTLSFSSVTQHSGANLTGGGWSVSNGATLVFSTGSNITTIQAPASVTLDGATSTFARINSLATNQGSFTITNGRAFTTVGALSNSGTLTVGPASTLTVPGTFTNSATVAGNGVITANSYAMQSGSVSPVLAGAAPLTKTTAGTATLTGINTYTGATTVNGGTLVMTQGLKSGNALTIADTAKAVIPASSPDTFNPPATVPSGTNAAGSKVSSLSIAGTGQLDLNNNDMVVEHDGSLDLHDIRDLIASGYNFGGQDGPGIISTTAALTDPFTFTLGYADNASLPLPYGTTIGLGTFFAGFDVDDTAALIKFTWVGDVTLDGVFDFQDLSIFNGNYDAGATTGRVWTDGDLNYDGTIDFQDLSLFNGTYDPSKPSLPEPARVGMLGAFIVGASARRPGRRVRRGC